MAIVSVNNGHHRYEIIGKEGLEHLINLAWARRIDPDGEDMGVKIYNLRAFKGTTKEDRELLEELRGDNEHK